MDKATLQRVAELAEQGLPVCLKQVPNEPGLRKTGDDYQALIAKLKKLDHVKTSWDAMTAIPPIITGAERFDYWCRETSDALYVFLANPRSKNLKFPLEYGQSLNKQKEELQDRRQFPGKDNPGGPGVRSLPIAAA